MEYNTYPLYTLPSILCNTPAILVWAWKEKHYSSNPASLPHPDSPVVTRVRKSRIDHFQEEFAGSLRILSRSLLG